MTNAVKVPGAIVTIVADSWENLRCDNVDVCGSELIGQITAAKTDDRARVRGWHIYPWGSSSKEARHVLCPACVGQRMRLKPGPEMLDGQWALFDL
jgi:hypothetical protein